MSVRVNVRQFGPISSGEVELRPLTVFVGPNNTGKSYLATLAYAVMLSARRVMPNPSSPIYLSSSGPSLLDGFPPKELKDIEAQIGTYLKALRSKRRKTPPKVPPDLLRFLHRLIEAVLIKYALTSAAEVERCFGSKLPELARNGLTSEFQVRIAHGDLVPWEIELRLGDDGPTASVLTHPDYADILADIIERSLIGDELDPFHTSRSLFYYAQFHPMNDLGRSDYLDYMAVMSVAGAAINLCFEGFPDFRYYLPAARSGILQSHKALAAFVISRAPLAGLEDMGIPRLSGVVADFINRVLSLEPERRQSRFADVAGYLERDVMDGHVEIVGHRPSYPEISYESHNVSHPLHRTSSMVSEIAPVVLFLRYLVDPDEFLIVEEPEAHLHPRSQVAFARAFARIVRGGANVLLTTHSDYFLSQLNILIRAAELSDDQQERLGIDDADTLTASRVAAYMFCPTADGTTVQEMTVTSGEGISEASFAEVSEALYDQTVALEQTTNLD